MGNHPLRTNISQPLSPAEQNACRAYVVDSRLLSARSLMPLLGEVDDVVTDEALAAEFNVEDLTRVADLRVSLRRCLNSGYDTLMARAQLLRSALGKSCLAQSMLLYAGHPDIRVIFGSFLPDRSSLVSLVGHHYSYLGFISTSAQEAVAEDNARGRSDLAVVMEFELAQGHPAVDMAQFGDVGGGEFEVLLGGGDFEIVEARGLTLRRLGREDIQQVLRLKLRP